MSVVEMKVPSPGESITEVQIAKWIKKDGDYVEKDEELAEIDSDKATLTIAAEQSGTLSIKIKEGETIAVGTVVCTIDDQGKATTPKKADEKATEKAADKPAATDKQPAAPAVETPATYSAVVPSK